MRHAREAALEKLDSWADLSRLESESLRQYRRDRWAVATALESLADLREAEARRLQQLIERRAALLTDLTAVQATQAEAARSHHRAPGIAPPAGWRRHGAPCLGRHRPDAGVPTARHPRSSTPRRVRDLAAHVDRGDGIRACVGLTLVAVDFSSGDQGPPHDHGVRA